MICRKYVIIEYCEYNHAEEGWQFHSDVGLRENWKLTRFRSNRRKSLESLKEDDRRREEERQKAEEDRKKANEELQKADERARKQEEQSKKWMTEGRCRFCGGGLSRLGKKCKSCGRQN